MDLKRWINRSLFEWDQKWGDIAQCVGLSVAGLALATACSALDWGSLSQRSLRIIGSVGAAYLCFSGASRGRELARLSTLYEVRQKFRIEAAKAIYAQEIKNLSNPAYNPEPITLHPFDWQSLRDTTEYPHIAIIGKTGQGKSTLAEYLCTLLGGMVIAVAPHWEPGDFPSADVVVGIGRDYGGAIASEPAVDFTDILAGQVVTVAGFIKSLHQEMTHRYQGDRKKCQPINIVLDEFNAYAKLEGLGDLIKELVREGRKVGLRLIFLCQGTEVKSMGIEGEGSLRMNLNQVRLGNFATEHAKMLLNKQKLHSPDYLVWSAIVDHFKLTKRPCLVDEDLGEIPSLPHGSIPANPNQLVLGVRHNPGHTQTQTQTQTQFLERCLELDCVQPDTQRSGGDPCPFCGSVSTKRNGRYKGKPRQRCNDCGKTWT